MKRREFILETPEYTNRNASHFISKCEALYIQLPGVSEYTEELFTKCSEYSFLLHRQRRFISFSS